MELTVWTYEGPPHVGAMRVANSMRDVHFVLHAPQGDTYADLLFTMIERNRKRPPVTYTTFQARDLSGDTAEIFKTAARDAVARFRPQALLVGASCTAELIQDDPGGLAKTLGLNVPVVPLEMPSYQKKENWGAAETFYRLVRAFAGGAGKPETAPDRASCNILGPTSLGFRNRDDIVEVVRLLGALGIRVNNIAPGWIVTEMHFGHASDPQARKAELESLVHEKCIMRRLGRPDEIAAAVFFLASDEASYITGTTLHVDGGQGIH